VATPETAAKATTRVSTATDDDLRNFCAMSRAAHPGEPVCDPDFVRWKHLSSPSGSSIKVEVVDASGELRGRIWGMRRTLLHRGRRIAAINPVDLVINEEHRSFSTLITLMRKALLEPQSQGQLVYHTSNPTTGYIYERAMRMAPVLELDAGCVPIRPISLVAALSNRRNRFEIVDAFFQMVIKTIGVVAGRRVTLTTNPQSVDFQRIAEIFHKDQVVANERSSVSLQWRLGGPTDSAAYSYSLQSVAYQGEILGWIGFADREIDGMAVRFVLDIVVPEADPRQVKAIWWKVIAETCGRSVDCIVFYGNSEGNEQLRKLISWPLIRVPRSRLPQRLPVFIHHADLNLTHDDVRAGYWTLSDFDMI
jgi:hypothetical protein